MAITINGSGTITGVSAGGLPDGTVDADTLASTLDLSGKTMTYGLTDSDISGLATGKVLQVVVGSSDSWATTSSDSSYTSAGLSTNITPSSTSSKILTIAHMNGVYKSNGSSNNMLDMQFFQDGTALGVIAATVWETGTTLLVVGSATFSALNSPSTTSQITYDVRFRSR